MQPLDKALRSKLERTVREARDIAEVAATASLEQLGVGEINPYAHLNDDERKLRVRLRAHGRQLGDFREPDGKQEILRLVEEVAYEHWHRMLFARFLAENSLLMYPDPVDPIPITLEECEDLAAGEGAKNGWELAARFAAKMLPQIFRPDSPVFQLTLPPEHQQRLEKLLAELPEEIFFASDSLGWVYQFWQAKKKDDINASEVKIGARELPVVTQLFTEPYMVSFLLDNSLGAWLAARRLSEDDLRNTKSEKELRQKAALPGVPLEYLRFVRNEDGRWRPAAGTFNGWPEHLSKFRALDPCTGSGHFLVAALPMLASMRMEFEGLSARDAVDAVLRDNLYGLEIDPRCVELAAFTLALAAWRYPGAEGYRVLPKLNLACSGHSISAKKEEWLALAGEDANSQIVLANLYNQFEHAQILGSLINPKTGLSERNLLGLNWEDISLLLDKALSNERDDEKKEMGVVAQGIAEAAKFLSSHYSLICTNVPYLTRSKQQKVLMDYCENDYEYSKNELGYVSADRFMKMLISSGCIALVQPQNMLYMHRYKSFRKYLLSNYQWRYVARLGPHAFETISGEVVNVGLFIFENKNDEIQNHLIHGLDVSDFRTPSEKANALRIIEQSEVYQGQILKSPDSAFSLERNNNKVLLLEEYAECYQGLRTGDANRFIRNVWELKTTSDRWELFQTSSDSSSGFFSGYTGAILWDEGAGELHKYARENRSHLHDMHESGNRSWNKKGMAIGQITIRPTRYLGYKYDNPIAVITPYQESHLDALCCFLMDNLYAASVKEINRGLYVTNAALLKIPFDLDHWQKVAAERYPNGLPKPYSDDPTQWIFHGHPAQSDAPLQVAVARLLGYRWPAELNPQMDLSDDARAWVKRCDDLLEFADDDGIICISPVRGESAAADYLLNLLAAAYGPDWSTNKLNELLKQADHAGKSLESWLRDKFFLQHCRLFQHRPFIWHIWDGLHDGFAALVNYHKLDAKLMESLIYTYLGDWIARQKADIQKGVDGAEERLAAAEVLKKRLETILEGEAPYDIFVRWKPQEAQPIGWNPDLNDGVRLNIRPFMSVPDVGKKGAGVLREKPSINWNKDRGKDVQTAPWYHLFKGDRINDHHLSLKEKGDSRGEDT